MFGKRHNKPQNRIDSLIGADTKIEGHLHFSGGLRIDGTVEGNVIASSGKPSTLVLSELGQIRGAIETTHLVINGSVTGPVRATEYLELQSKAKITGDVQYKSLEIQLGAVVEGRLTHLAGEKEKVVPFKAAVADS